MEATWAAEDGSFRAGRTIGQADSTAAVDRSRTPGGQLDMVRSPHMAKAWPGDVLRNSWCDGGWVVESNGPVCPETERAEMNT